MTGLRAFHLAEKHRWLPACKVHATGVERLCKPDIRFYSAWANGGLATIGALKELRDERGEIKSMRAGPEWLGRIGGEAMLLHLMAEARGRRLSLGRAGGGAVGTLRFRRQPLPQARVPRVRGVGPSRSGRILHVHVA